MKKKRIVVTGMGLVSCFGMDVDVFYESLLAGKSGVTPISAFPCEDFSTRFAAAVQNFDWDNYMDKKQGRRVDPFIRFAMVAGKKALENAGLGQEKLDTLNKERCGVLVGSGMGGMSVFYEGNETLLTKGYRKLTPFFVPYIITNMASGLLSIDIGFRGPNYSISTACATGSHCIIAAAQHIERGDADLMICGGTEAAINAIGVGGFIACKALSERNDDYQGASRPWDKTRDGFVIGDGSGVLILESLEHAEKRGARILGEYRGGAISADAYHMTSPREDGSGVAECIEKAILDAGVAKEEVNYINAHATSTVVGDICEVRAIKKVFGSQTKKIKINATKSMIGHCLGAAGGIEAITTIKAINTSMLHPTKNLHDPDEEVKDLDVVYDKPVPHKVNIALSNSFGFGGHNAVVVLSAYRESNAH